MLTYTELITMDSFEDRYNYLRKQGIVGMDTFGANRIFYEKFLQSEEWKEFRRNIILRDTYDGWCCDLGCKNRPITGTIIVHHLNSVTLEDLKTANIEVLLNADNVICVSLATHNAIHYGDIRSLPKEPIVRKPNDTCPWRK